METFCSSVHCRHIPAFQQASKQKEIKHYKTRYLYHFDSFCTIFLEIFKTIQDYEPRHQDSRQHQIGTVQHKFGPQAAPGLNCSMFLCPSCRLWPHMASHGITWPHKFQALVGELSTPASCASVGTQRI